jgi:hypothetical protein
MFFFCEIINEGAVTKLHNRTKFDAIVADAIGPTVLAGYCFLFSAEAFNLIV